MAIRSIILTCLALVLAACGQADPASGSDDHRVCIGELQFRLTKADLEEFYFDRRPDWPKPGKLYRADALSSRDRYKVQSDSGETHSAKVSIRWQEYADPDASYKLDKPEGSTLLFDYIEMGSFRGREAVLAVSKKEFVNLHGRSLGRDIMFSEYLAPRVRLSVRATEDSLPLEQVPMFLNELGALVDSWIEDAPSEDPGSQLCSEGPRT